jgi:PAS domain S-box-containing protein
MLLALQLRGSWPEWVVGGITFAGVVILLAYLLALALRKYLRPAKRLDALRSAAPADDFAPPQPPSENQPAFLSASLQAVIQRLREQEKELEALHRAEKERAQQTERLSEAITRHMPTGLLLVNSAGLITTANPAAEAALGAGALAYRRYTDILGADSPLGRLMEACLGEGRAFQREEVEHATPAGGARRLGVTVSPIAQPGGRVTGALCLLSDLTELTELQRQVRLKENLAALGEMAAGIAHEFKNALAIISGYAQMIRGETPGGQLADSAERILKETRALTHVVTEFLRYARPLEVMHETVALAPLVEQVAGQLREALPQVRIETRGEFREVSGDEALLRQALLNLGRNAAEAAAGGRVELRGWVEEAAGRPAQRIAVADSGPGIPADDLPKIFLPFYTTKADGTGLGLAVVQKIVLQHGGSVEARNRAEGGAEVILTLPLPGARDEAVDSAPRRI